MQDKEIYCEDCTYATQRTERFWKWLCMRAPKEPKTNFVKRSTITEPYEKCLSVNKDGNCPMFESLKRVENDTV